MQLGPEWVTAPSTAAGQAAGQSASANFDQCSKKISSSKRMMDPVAQRDGKLLTIKSSPYLVTSSAAVIRGDAQAEAKKLPAYASCMNTTWKSVLKIKGATFSNFTTTSVPDISTQALVTRFTLTSGQRTVPMEVIFVVGGKGHYQTLCSYFGPYSAVIRGSIDNLMGSSVAAIPKSA
jgi:hypothetical protein